MTTRDAIDDLVDWQLGVGSEVARRKCVNCGTEWATTVATCPYCHGTTVTKLL